MKRPFLTFWLCLSILLPLPDGANASTTGLSKEGTYGIWDTFPVASSYSSLAPNEVTPGFSPLLFLQSTPAGEDFGGHEEYFDLGEGFTNWYIPVTSIYPVTSLSLQIKMGTQLPEFYQPVLMVSGNFYSPGSPTVTQTGEVVNGQEMNVITWKWSHSLPVSAAFAFDLQNTTGDNVVIDAIAIQVIPEPSSLFAFGAFLLAGGLCAGRRRSKRGSL